MRRLLMYPSIAGGVVMLVVAFLMVYLVPQLVSFIEGMGRELPAHDPHAHPRIGRLRRVLVSRSARAPCLLRAPCAPSCRASPSASYAVDDLKLRAWVVGPIMKKIILARFAGSFALLYGSGITVAGVHSHLRGHCRESGGGGRDPPRRQKDRRGCEHQRRVRGDRTVLAPLVLRMLRLGESTGGLDTALLNVSRYYNRGITESMEQLQAMLGPAITVSLGAILFWVIVSVLGPIYDLVTTIGI